MKTAIDNWWNTERPTPVPEFSLETLVEMGYLEDIPRGFSRVAKMRRIKGDREAVYEVAVAYVARDVDFEELRRQPWEPEELLNLGKVYVMKFRLMKWW